MEEYPVVRFARLSRIGGPAEWAQLILAMTLAVFAFVCDEVRRVWRRVWRKS